MYQQQLHTTGRNPTSKLRFRAQLDVGSLPSKTHLKTAETLKLVTAQGSPFHPHPRLASFRSFTRGRQPSVPPLEKQRGGEGRRGRSRRGSLAFPSLRVLPAHLPPSPWQRPRQGSAAALGPEQLRRSLLAPCGRPAPGAALLTAARRVVRRRSADTRTKRAPRRRLPPPLCPTRSAAARCCRSRR